MTPCIVCPKCLFENLLDDMYCGGCGRKIGGRSEERGSAQTNGKISETLPTLEKFRADPLGEAEKGYLKRVLAVTQRDIAMACQISGLSRSRLYVLKKMGDLNCLPKEFSIFKT
jgi:hypothetical protein